MNVGTFLLDLNKIGLMKKTSFILMMLASVLILTSMSQCNRDNRLLRYSPVAAEIDGVLYYSGEYEYDRIIIQDNPYSLEHINRDSCFAMSIDRRIFSDGGDGADLHISVDEKVPLEMHRKYPLGVEGGSMAYIMDAASTGGYVLFTELKHEGVSGVFEFTAKDEAGAVVRVTNGTFENILTSID